MLVLRASINTFTTIATQRSSVLMTENDVQQRVLKVVAEVLNKKEDEIRLDASLRDDLHLDSLQQMTLFIVLEDEFKRMIPPEEVTGLDTVKDVIAFIEKKTQETAVA
jgi:acyl carrier protein